MAHVDPAFDADPTPPVLYYVTPRMLADKLGRDLLTAVCDDNNDGSPDAPAVRRILLDSEAYVEGFVHASSYPIIQVREKRPSQVVRLVLEHAYASAVERHPEIPRGDPEKMFLRVERDCKLIGRPADKGGIRLDLDVDDPKPGNVGGKTARIGSAACLPNPFFENLGDFPGGSRYG